MPFEKDNIKTSNSLIQALVILSAWTLFPLSLENENTIFLALISFIPFFYLAKNMKNTTSYIAVVIIASMLFSFRWYIWIIETGYYLKFALLIITNTILYSIPLVVLRYRSILSFILIWIGLELFHLHSSFGSPVPVIGNYLSFRIDLIQWYEFTGVLGGTCFVFIINWAIWSILSDKKGRRKKATLLTSFVLLSILFSYYLKPAVLNEEIEVFSLATDLNARTKKYTTKEFKLVNQYIDTTANYVTNNTQLIIWPETSLFELRNIESPQSVDYTNEIASKLAINDSCSIVSGAILKEYFHANEVQEISADLIPSIAKNQYFRIYNSILKFPADSLTYRVKEKLVPFNEYQPDNFLGELLFNLDEKNPFNFSKYRSGKNIFHAGSNIKLLPLICFESAFGNFVAKNSKEANLISVSLNEGWYDSKRGSKIFNQIATCRAIENRKYVITSSNCGFASIIKSNGEKEIGRKGESKLGKVSLSNGLTVYALLGDSMIVLVLIFSLIIKMFKNEKNQIYFSDRAIPFLLAE